MKKTITVFLCLALLICTFTFPNMNAFATELMPDNNIPIYRLYNPNTGEHLYTSDANEKNVLYGEHGWGYEGIAWYAPTSGTPVYRLYNSILCNHLYTTDSNEVYTLTSTDSSWSIDNNGNPLFYSGGDIPIYRVYNRELNGMHHLTTDQNEYATLPKYGWTQEGVSLSAMLLGNPISTTYCEGKCATWSDLINLDFDKRETDLFKKMSPKNSVILWKDVDFDLAKGNPLNAYTDLEYAVMTIDELQNRMDNLANFDYNKALFESDKNSGDPALLANWTSVYLYQYYWSNTGEHLKLTGTYASIDHQVGYTYLYKDGYSDNNIVAIIIYKDH